MDDEAPKKKIDVEYVATLARIRLTEDERKEFQGQLEDIVAYVEKMSELDVSGVEPTAHGIPVENVFREDEVKGSLPGEQVLANAPSERDGHFQVPKIIE